MSVNERGGFRPPKLDKLVVQCPACDTFNSPKSAKCKKCGADLPQEEQKGKK